MLAQISADQPQSAIDTLSEAKKRAVAQQVSQYTLFVALIGLVTIIALILFVMTRRRKLEREREEAAKNKGDSAPPVSAWEEAGRRMQVPRELDEVRELPDEDDSSPESLRGRAGGPGGVGGIGGVSGKPESEQERDPLRRTPPASGSGRAKRRDAESAVPLPASDQGQRPVALITGGAKRVGRAIVREFARNGFDIWFTYNTSEEDAREVSREVSALGRKVTSFRVDFSETGEVEEIAKQLAQTLPRLDVLVHNAAAYQATPIDEFDTEAAAKQLRVNALAPLVLTAHLRKLLSDSPFNGGGSIIAMLDIHAMGKPRRNYSAYTMSKAALHEMVLNLAKDLGPFVRVNGVAPGVVAWEEPGKDINTNGPGFDAESSGGASLGSGKKPSDEQGRYLRRIPLGRFGEPEDAAKAVYWLATQATYVTGQVIRVDGGRWLA